MKTLGLKNQMQKILAKAMKRWPDTPTHATNIEVRYEMVKYSSGNMGQQLHLYVAVYEQACHVRVAWKSIAGTPEEIYERLDTLDLMEEEDENA